MTDIDDVIARLDRWLATNRPDYYASLQPPATELQLDRFEAKFSLHLPRAFRRLYRWRDGQDPMSFEAMQFNRMFSGLDAISETKELLDGMIGFDFDAPTDWRRGWVPFLHNGGGSHLCLDLEAVDGGVPGQLIGFWKADSDRPIEFASIDAWLEDLVASMEGGTLELN
jgi:cell wall assembly regulator SMI1